MKENKHRVGKTYSPDSNLGCGKCAKKLDIDTAKLEEAPKAAVDFIRVVCSSCSSINEVSLLRIEEKYLNR